MSDKKAIRKPVENTTQVDISLPEFEFLTFYLEEKVFAIDILKVHEICTVQPLTKLPFSPDYVVGVINLRGAIIPIIDLRIRFSLSAKTYGALTTFIIISLEVDGQFKLIGAAVDKTGDVLAIPENKIVSEQETDCSESSQFNQGFVVDGESKIAQLNWKQILYT
ncbi:chemotaxis protein CheW [Pseudoalteromonas sp. MMG010]|uniref:chemotaxis protein CheW n=1 Tax=Pseudoalteromonas sp. MMG010 TaxID=2822685 RepID=UPI001B3A1524|nr:chemotaxis protein CheW [Pseudoalteromonas sp. MMG010]MBQ4834324.1 chemotaxis protein CheW [Pseudoalteromonas sp. MMG010]